MNTVDSSGWHEEDGWPYSPDECIRLEMACDAVAAHADRLGLDRPCEVLDVGCGIGPLRRWLPAVHFQITGIDISDRACDIARNNYDACHVSDVQADWPLPSTSVDAVHAGAVLEHVQDWHAPLNEANRCLRDGGLLVVTVPNLSYWKERRRLLMGRLPHWMRHMHHLHAYTPSWLRELVTMHGFQELALCTDRLNLPLLGKSKWARRVFAHLGSILVLSAQLIRRVRVEDASHRHLFPRHTMITKHCIEVHSDTEST